jgi:S1-C subfamily serine protease
VTQDQKAAEEMVRLSGQMGVPVTIIDGEVVVGFNRGRLQELLAAGAKTAEKIRFGLKVADADRMAPQQGSAPVKGAFVGEVAPGSLGEKAGLKAGDVITEISGKSISNAADIEPALAAIQKGNIVTVLFLRGSENRKSEIVV